MERLILQMSTNVNPNQGNFDRRWSSRMTTSTRKQETDPDEALLAEQAEFLSSGTSPAAKLVHQDRSHEKPSEQRTEENGHDGVAPGWYQQMKGVRFS